MKKELEIKETLLLAFFCMGSLLIAIAVTFGAGLYRASKTSVVAVNVGDCFLHDDPNAEEWEKRPDVLKVTQIGKKRLRAVFANGPLKGQEHLIGIWKDELDAKYKKVACP